MIARIMHNFMINNDVNVYNYWWIADSEPSGRDRDSQSLIQYYNEDDTYKIQKQGYVFGQFSRFIRPGYQRIANTNPFPQLGAGVTEPIDKSVTLGVSAYTNAAGNRLVVVAINDSADTETIDLTINNADGSIQDLDAWRTSATENMEPIHPVSVTDDVAILSLPPYSITTYVNE